MENAPEVQNPTASFVNKGLRIAIDVGVTLASAAAKTALPILGLPVVSWVTDFVIGKVGDYFYVFFAEHATITILHFQTAQEKQSFDGAINSLRIAKASGDQNAHDEALKKAKEALAKLAHWDGVAHP